MEKETIEAFKENGALNIEEVINKYNIYIYKILKTALSNEPDIEEVLSDIFIIFWKNYAKLDESTKVKPYLVGIAKNLIRKKYQQYNINFNNIDEYEVLDNIDIEELIANNEKSNIIQDTLKKMKENDRQAFIMFYYKQKKIKEIAKLLKITEAKVKIILHRGRKEIKKNLKERGYNYGDG